MRVEATILTESGDGIGFGHLVRMTAAARALERKGLLCRRIIQHHGECVPLLEGWECLDWRNEDPARWMQGNGVVIVDSYLVEASFYAALVDAGVSVVAVDDFGRLGYEGCFVLNPNPFADSVTYAQGVEAKGGAAYVLLREEVRTASGSFTVRPKMKRILVTLGGADPHGLFPKVAAVVAATGVEVCVVCGQDYPEIQGKKLNGVTWLAALEGKDWIQEVLQSDLVVSACGQTLHELACMEVPTLAICVGEDQLLNQDFYLNCRFLEQRLDWRQQGWERAMSEELTRLADPKHRRSRAVSASSIGGDGADRFAEWVEEIGKASIKRQPSLHKI